MGSLLNEVAGKELYTFLDEFSGYNQVKISPEDFDRMAFIIKLGVFVAPIMMFVLKNDLTNFQRNLWNLLQLPKGIYESLCEWL